METTTRKKIIIFENQKIEFLTIRDTLKDSYDIIPEENNFIEFVNYIRIWVNEEYAIAYRELALDGIMKFIQKDNGDINPQLIIMDHILGGSYSCLTGINLAEKLVAKIIGIDSLLDEKIEEMTSAQIKFVSNVPLILFLSKTEYTNEGRLAEYEEYKKKIAKIYIKQGKKMKDCETALSQKIDAHTMWTHKGYFGDEILQPEYIKKYVIENGIEKLLNKSAHEIFCENLDFIIYTYQVQESMAPQQKLYLKKFEEIKKAEMASTQEQINLIEEYANTLKQWESNKKTPIPVPPDELIR